MSTVRIGSFDMLTREPASGDAPGTLYASNLTREGTSERNILRTVCASITASGAGKVRWTRVGKSEGSGRVRAEGQWDSRDIVKVHLNDVGNGILYLFVVLNAASGKGSGVRKVPIRALLPVEVAHGPALA